MPRQPFHGEAQLLISTLDCSLSEEDLDFIQCAIEKAVAKRVGKKNVYTIELVGYDGDWGDCV